MKKISMVLCIVVEFIIPILTRIHDRLQSHSFLHTKD